jgi:hypothetical protein
VSSIDSLDLGATSMNFTSSSMPFIFLAAVAWSAPAQASGAGGPGDEAAGDATAASAPSTPAAAAVEAPR